MSRAAARHHHKEYQPRARLGGFDPSKALDRDAAINKATVLTQGHAGKLGLRHAVQHEIHRTFEPRDERWTTVVHVTFESPQHDRRATFAVNLNTLEVEKIDQ